MTLTRIGIEIRNPMTLNNDIEQIMTLNSEFRIRNSISLNHFPLIFDNTLFFEFSFTAHPVIGPRDGVRRDA